MLKKAKLSVDISVILTIWKRAHLDEQIENILSQTVTPGEIIVVQCCNFVDLSFPDVESYGIKLKYVYSSYEFDAIPTYMMFDKKGELLQENIGYLSNEVAEEWIEEALGN